MTDPIASQRPRLTKLGIAALALLGAGWLAGLVSFVASDGHFEATLPRRRAPPVGLHNLSALDFGPTVRASSYFADWQGHHHPLFLVDGRDRPELVEKWASAQGDEHPWVEILWREPHDLEQVTLRHAGSVEASDLTVRRYRVQCLTSAPGGPRLDVEGNQDAVARHDLHCPAARGVRVDFVPNGKDIVRVFELEAWGR